MSTDTSLSVIEIFVRSITDMTNEELAATANYIYDRSCHEIKTRRHAEKLSQSAAPNVNGSKE